MAAFRRLAPTDYGHFLATIENDLSEHVPALGSGKQPLLLAAPAAEVTKPPAAGSLREAVLAVLADGRQRSTLEIRRELEVTRSVKSGTLNTEIFTLRKRGIVRSEGRGRASRHTLVATAPPPATTPSASARERTTQKPRRKRDDDDDDHSARDKRSPSLDAAQIYAKAIGGHHLLSKQEEWELSRRLEETEVEIWRRLLASPLASAGRDLLRTLDPPIKAASAKTARTADIDRQIALRVIAAGSDQLSKDDRKTLRALIGESDRIRDRFASCNLRMVPSTIRRHGYHRSTQLSMSDLIQEGNLGLIKAIPRFDYRRGFRFSTFATWSIRHYLVRARQNLGSEVRVPVHLHDLANKARMAKADLREKLGRDPSPTELCKALKISAKTLTTLQNAWLKHRESIPTFNSVGDDGRTPLPSDERRPALRRDPLAATRGGGDCRGGR